MVCSRDDLDCGVRDSDIALADEQGDGRLNEEARPGDDVDAALTPALWRRHSPIKS